MLLELDDADTPTEGRERKATAIHGIGLDLLDRWKTHTSSEKNYVFFNWIENGTMEILGANSIFCFLNVTMYTLPKTNMAMENPHFQ